jgi:hypothetical protein
MKKGLQGKRQQGEVGASEVSIEACGNLRSARPSGFQVGVLRVFLRLKERREIMARRSRLSLDRVDSDRVGRMGGRRQRERSVNSELARRLSGFKGRGKVRGRESGGRRQRVVVKALVSRHKAGKARGSIARHASYPGRERASADGKPGVFYDASREQVNGRKEVVTWAEDRHHFRLIVSPEHGKDIPDMTAYVRDVMRRVERDLDTKLEWIAVNHHNTDNPHAHVMMRGKKEDGTDLVIPRRYISYGIRDRASDVATELLGERSAMEVRSAKLKEVEAERFTSLDRMIERHLERGREHSGESNRIDVSPSRHIGFGERAGRWRETSARCCANWAPAVTSSTNSMRVSGTRPVRWNG